MNKLERLKKKEKHVRFVEGKNNVLRLHPTPVGKRVDLVLSRTKWMTFESVIQGDSEVTKRLCTDMRLAKHIKTSR